MLDKTKGFSSMLVVTMILSGLFPVTISILANTYLPDWFWIRESLHGFVEGVGAFAAIMLTILLLMSRPTKETAHHVWIACALLGMGILDGFHASVPPGETSIWLRSSSILFGGLLFTLVWLPVSPLFLKSPTSLIWGVLIAAGTFGGYSVLFADSLPTMSITGSFTSTVKILNHIGGILFLVSGTYFVIKYRSTQKSEDLLFVNFCILFGMAGLFSHSSFTWKAGWWLWHFLRLTVYLYILKYLFMLYQKRNNTLERNNDELRQRMGERTTAVVKANQRLQAIEFRLSKIITSNAFSVIIINKNGIVIFVNPAAKALFGRTSKDFIGQKFDFPIAPNQTSEIVIRKKGGKKITAQMRTVELDWGGKITYLASCFDITEIAQLREKLKDMSFVDELTQLYNRRGFMELAKQQIKIGQRKNNITLLVYADLDNLKSINDNMGHKAGDLALIDTADILRATFRKSDIIGRIGGDEFAILAVEASKGNLNTIDKRLQKNINIHNNTKKRSYELSISIGIARYYPKSDFTIDELITQADEQMYLQKRRKKNIQIDEITAVGNHIEVT